MTSSRRLHVVAAARTLTQLHVSIQVPMPALAEPQPSLLLPQSRSHHRCGKKGDVVVVFYDVAVVDA